MATLGKRAGAWFQQTMIRIKDPKVSVPLKKLGAKNAKIASKFLLFGSKIVIFFTKLLILY